MKLLFDTSTVVASLVAAHPHHTACWPWFQQVVKRQCEGALCTHSLAELYATLSAMPARPRPTPAEVRQLLRESVLSNFRLIDLDRADYERALDLAAARLLPSGAIFDALIEVAARKWKARHLVTLNIGDFARMADGAGDWLVDPRARAPA